MKIPTKKLIDGFALPVLGLGTWEVGGRMSTDTSRDKQDIFALKKAIESEITRFDTAELYGGGHAEELTGIAIKPFNRKKLFITSKVYKTNLYYDQVIKSAQNSLKRLQTDYLDLYLIHAPNSAIPLRETIQALDDLVKNGLIKYIGVSNFSKERLAEAQKLTQNKIVLNQVHYNLIYRDPETTGLLKYCQENDVFLEAFRPIQKGKILPGNKFPEFSKIMKKYNKTAIQIALNWLISQDNVVTIVKTTNLDHLEENLGAVGSEMEKQDVKFLRENFPQQPDYEYSLG